MPTAIIWGASGAIATAVATQLTAQNWTVVGVSRHPEDIEHIVQHAICADVSRDHEVQKAIYEAGIAVDDINLMLYAAGDIAAATTASLTPTDWQRIINANLTGAFLTTHHSLPLLAENSHIIFIGAVSERMRLPRLGAYAAAKAGLEAFADALRKEERRKKVTVVRPGAVATPFWDKVPMTMPKDAAPPEKVAKRIIDAYTEGHSGQLDLT